MYGIFRHKPGSVISLSYTLQIISHKSAGQNASNAELSNNLNILLKVCMISVQAHCTHDPEAFDRASCRLGWGSTGLLCCADSPEGAVPKLQQANFTSICYHRLFTDSNRVCCTNCSQISLWLI